MFGSNLRTKYLKQIIYVICEDLHRRQHCYVLLIQRSVRQKESTQDRNSRKGFNYLYSYSRSFLILL